MPYYCSCIKCEDADKPCEDCNSHLAKKGISMRNEIVLPKCPNCLDWHYSYFPCVSNRKYSNPKEPTMAKEAERFNEGKPRLSYFRRSFQKMVEGIAWVKTFGANKYEEDNWRAGGKPDTEYWDSMDRHLALFVGGEVYDKDSGCHHLSHAVWNLCALLELNYPDVPMRDVAIYEDRMAYWAARKASKKANEELKTCVSDFDRKIRATGVDTGRHNIFPNLQEAAEYRNASPDAILHACREEHNNVIDGVRFQFEDEVTE